MIDLEENKRIIEDLRNRINNIYRDLKLDNKKEELEELESKTSEEEFWNNSNTSNSVLKQIKDIKNTIKQYDDLNSQISDLIDLNELLKIEADDELEKQLIALTKASENNMAKFEVKTLLTREIW